jgi:hypothetical protein
MDQDFKSRTALHSATERPPIALCTSLSACSAPRTPTSPTATPFPLLLLMFRGPRPGCLTPSAAPSILFPGSPILGGPSACKIAGSSAVGVTAEFISSLRVGCEGRLGSVGEGSLLPFGCGCSGIEPLVFTWDRAMPCPLRPPPPLLVRVGNTEMDAARLLCPRDGLDVCCPREFTV